MSARALVSIPVGVVVERRKAESPWLDFLWRPVSVLAGEPGAAPWTTLGVNDDATLFYAGMATVELHRTETTNYRDNLASGSPALWVVLRPTDGEPPYTVLTVTADPAEGEGATEAGNDLVETVPMPETIRLSVAAFVAEHHVEQPFFKRQRDRAEPATIARRGQGEKEK